MTRDHETADVRSRSLEQEILDARSSIFDEELFHELHREAQYLANQGVKCIDNVILLPLGKDEQLAITLEPSEKIDSAENLGSDISCRTTSLALKLLLSLAHLQKLHDRSQPPPPLRQEQRPRPAYPILKPVVEVLQHRSRMTSIWQMMAGLRACMVKAGLPFSIESSLSTSKGLSTVNIPKHHGPPRMHSIRALVADLTSNSLRLRILDQIAPISVQAHTTISPPDFGTTYYVLREFEPQAEEKISCSSQQDLELELFDLLKNAIKQYITETILAWNNAEVGIELITKYDSKRKSRDNLVVSINKHRLEISWSRSSGLGHQQQNSTWYADAKRDSEKATLREVLEALEEG